MAVTDRSDETNHSWDKRALVVTVVRKEQPANDEHAHGHRQADRRWVKLTHAATSGSSSSSSSGGGGGGGGQRQQRQRQQRPAVHEQTVVRSGSGRVWSHLAIMLIPSLRLIASAGWSRIARPTIGSKLQLPALVCRCTAPHHITPHHITSHYIIAFHHTRRTGIGEGEERGGGGGGGGVAPPKPRQYRLRSASLAQVAGHVRDGEYLH